MNLPAEDFSYEELLSEEERKELERIENDPFDLPSKEIPNTVKDAEWERVAWHPKLKITKDDKRQFRLQGRPSDLAQSVVHHMGKPLSLGNHAFLYPIFNRRDEGVVMKCSRQISKCVDRKALILKEDGLLVRADEIQVGDRVVAFDVKTGKASSGMVKWRSEIKKKSTVTIKTRQGHESCIAKTHPVWMWGRWVDAGDIVEGDRIGVVRGGGRFLGAKHVAHARIRITAYLLGDGHIGKEIGFTKSPGPSLDEFASSVLEVGGSFGISRSASASVTARLHAKGPIRGWMRRDGLLGKKAGGKFVPSWVYGLSREDTALFLNRLWSTDGHVTTGKKENYQFGYNTTSPRLARDVQTLLWKFGIPSKIGRSKPEAYKGTSKHAYMVRVETQEGCEKFLSEIGALGKSDKVTPNGKKENNNQDTFPIEIEDQLREIIDSRGNQGRYGRRAEKDKSLRSSGLMAKLAYPLSRSKLRKYIAFFRKDERYDQGLVDNLEAHLSSDIYWDRVVSVSRSGKRECIDFEVEGLHTFVSDGLVTHNSTTIGNIQVTESLYHPHMRSLYVSPSMLQTRQYSNEKLRPTIYNSPFIRKYFIDKTVIDQVLEKTLCNGSYMFLRYAFLTPARARGIPASLVFFDEAQDLLKDNIKIISQSLSASSLHGIPGREIISGTPLTFSNTLEEYWQWSTRSEWMVPCTRHTPKIWNALDEENVGKEGLICRRCGKAIRPGEGQWAMMAPEESYMGYHITQLMVPWKQDPKRWKKDILLPLEKWPEAKVKNEIFGVSCDNATSPIGEIALRECCHPAKQKTGWPTEHFVERLIPQLRGRPIFAGIDWGEGREEGGLVAGKKRSASWTVLTLGTYIDHDLFWPFFMKRYTGKEVDPEVILPDIHRIANDFGVYRFGADWGFGWGVNSRLVTTYGRSRVMEFAYSGNLREPLRWDPIAYKFIVNKSHLLSTGFNDMKEGKFIFPIWSQFEAFAKDILAEYSEYSESTRTMRYDHPMDKPDDALHSLLLCRLAAHLTRSKS